MKRLITLSLILIFSSYSLNLHVKNGDYKCTNDTYSLLKDKSAPVCDKGEIYLSIGTHQYLGLMRLKSV
jgi:hypothetical protein